MGAGAETRTALRVCPFCEATCGLSLTLEGDRVTAVHGDDEDVFSRGYLCPKGVAIGELHDDPDRLREPLVRRGGRLEPAGWDEAFEAADDALNRLIERHGREALAIYFGNPTTHNVSGPLYNPVLARAAGTRSIFSASTLDQMPKHVSVGLMYGDKFSIPVPDIDRCDYLVVMGADPFTSNGSLWTVPDLPGRMRALKARGGRLVVIDPRRSRTARAADRHLAILPGTDALLLLGVVHTLFAEDLVRLRRLDGLVRGIDDVRAVAAPYAPETVAARCGVAAEDIRTLARELAAAERGCLYGRIGTTTQRFGTLTSWLIEVVNVLCGLLDHEGGPMFPLAAAGHRNALPGPARPLELHRWRSRVSGLGEVYGELPSACLAEEIDTPGDGQIRGLITVAGNPARSAPGGPRLDAALADLEAMVCVDIYLNETTRHADVILPPPSPLARPHFDLAFNQLAVRNTARWSPPALSPDPGQPDEWEILLRLTGILTGQGPKADVGAVDAFVARTVIQREIAHPASPLHGRDPDELVALLEPRRGPERLIDFLLRSGPYGDAFGARDGLSLQALLDAPHGVDLGPLRPRTPEVLLNGERAIELAPAPVLEDLPRLAAWAQADGAPLTLVGRRHLRSNNSWMHNLPLLNSGTNRCTLHVHPDDAAAAGLADGSLAQVTARTGSVRVEVEVTEDIRPGVVS
ncbi:MAG TPA: molybdopterin-dependent oxidoreductase, partial [Egibacteraceae bacterium]|nr:molybdopterin-dependent oxidoreductase [Egibacteraceae bacterium]